MRTSSTESPLLGVPPIVTTHSICYSADVINYEFMKTYRKTYNSYKTDVEVLELSGLLPR